MSPSVRHNHTILWGYKVENLDFYVSLHIRFQIIKPNESHTIYIKLH